MSRHLTILTSPKGEEFYEAYGPLSKDRSKATVFHTNPLTLARPPRMGYGQPAPFWNCEREAEAIAIKQYQGWTYRNVPCDDQGNPLP